MKNLLGFSRERRVAEVMKKSFKRRLRGDAVKKSIEVKSDNRGGRRLLGVSNF